MLLLEIFSDAKMQDHGDDDKHSRYDPNSDETVLKKDDTRKTRLTLKDINEMRLASEDHDSQQKEEAKFVQKMYGASAQEDNLQM